VNKSQLIDTLAARFEGNRKQAAHALESVLDTIYFLFNEGYAAHAGDALVRQDLCVEALRLGRLIASSSLATQRFTHWPPSWRSKPPACRPGRTRPAI